MATREQERLAEIRDDATSWRRWGPYLSDRSWGTVREDYSADGNAWAYLPHDLRAQQGLSLGRGRHRGHLRPLPALGLRPRLLEPAAIRSSRNASSAWSLRRATTARTSRSITYYLDNTPTHSYMKFLYKYPQAEFPYDVLVEENQRRQGRGPEFELLDTGIFRRESLLRYLHRICQGLARRDRASASRPSIAARMRRRCDILPHLWFRNTWAWGPESWGRAEYPEPAIRPGPQGSDFISLLSDDSKMEELTNVPVRYRLGPRALYGPAAGRCSSPTTRRTARWSTAPAI